LAPSPADEQRLFVSLVVRRLYIRESLLLLSEDGFTPARSCFALELGDAVLKGDFQFNDVWVFRMLRVTLD
jgi:hypothetical protein